MKKGDYVRISGPLVIRRKNGKFESFSGRIARIVSVEWKRCRCDIGLEEPVFIPKTHLQKVA